jgi:prephenate dehydrogenase
MNSTFSKVLIVGLGLMGGSLAKMISEIYPHITLVGLVKTEPREELAADFQIFKKICTQVSDLDQDIELVIVCTPIKSIVPLVTDLSQHFNHDVLFTDIGSVKQEICDAIVLRNPSHHFIGGHPMAGSEKTGFLYSNAHLLTNKNWFLIPSSCSKKDDLLSQFLTSLSFKVIKINAEEHDYILAHTSHLPYLMSVLTVLSTCENLKPFPLSEKGYAGGFRDISRLSASDPNWGAAICQYNKAGILEAIQSVQYHLDFLKSKLEEEDFETLLDLFKNAKHLRNSLNTYLE